MKSLYTSVPDEVCGVVDVCLVVVCVEVVADLGVVAEGLEAHASATRDVQVQDDALDVLGEQQVALPRDGTGLVESENNIGSFTALWKTQNKCNQFHDISFYGTLKMLKAINFMSSDFLAL